MESQHAGVLAGLPFGKRAEIELEFAELLDEVEESLGDVRAVVRSLERALDRAFTGEHA